MPSTDLPMLRPCAALAEDDGAAALLEAFQQLHDAIRRHMLRQAGEADDVARRLLKEEQMTSDVRRQ